MKAVMKSVADNIADGNRIRKLLKEIDENLKTITDIPSIEWLKKRRAQLIKEFYA
jgi:hypothetical protein